MNSKIGRIIYLTLFAILYLSVALVSTLHAISFFGLANDSTLATILAITFEVGQAAVLFSILTSPGERKKYMPWVLMCVLTLVQVLGNIFSSYKYLITNSIDELRFFKEPVFVWTSLPDEQTTVILTYIIGSILPVVALFLTSMVTNYLDNGEQKTEDAKDIEKEALIADLEHQLEIERNKEPEIKEVIKEVEKEVIKEVPSESDKEEIEKLNGIIRSMDSEAGEKIRELESQIETLQNKEPEVKEIIKEVKVDNPEQLERIRELEERIKKYEEQKNQEVAIEEGVKQPIEQKQKMQSHFVNL